MTREQMKDRIEDILYREITLVGIDDYAVVEGYSDALEAIMKLWDQGFVYDLKKDKK